MAAAAAVNAAAAATEAGVRPLRRSTRESRPVPVLGSSSLTGLFGDGLCSPRKRCRAEAGDIAGGPSIEEEACDKQENMHRRKVKATTGASDSDVAEARDQKGKTRGQRDRINTGASDSAHGSDDDDDSDGDEGPDAAEIAGNSAYFATQLKHARVWSHYRCLLISRRLADSIATCALTKRVLLVCMYMYVLQSDQIAEWKQADHANAHRWALWVKESVADFKDRDLLASKVYLSV
jgi:hypothetical protein